MTDNLTGAKFLELRSHLAKSRHDKRFVRDVLIIEDETFDANRLEATLHVIYGYDNPLKVRKETTLSLALNAVLASMPELIFLDDMLKPNDNAVLTIPFLRRAGYDGPIVVVSGVVTRARRAELMAAGATDAIHKDDLDSVSVAEVLGRINAEAAGTSRS